MKANEFKDQVEQSLTHDYLDWDLTPATDTTFVTTLLTHRQTGVQVYMHTNNSFAFLADSTNVDPDAEVRSSYGDVLVTIPRDVVEYCVKRITSPVGKKSRGECFLRDFKGFKA